MKKLLVFIAIAAISKSTVMGQNDSTSVTTPNDSTSVTRPYNDNAGQKVRTNAGSKTSSFSIAVNPSLPIGHFNTYSSFGLGGYLGWESRFSKNFGVTLNAGYIDYFGKTADSIKYSDFNYIPVLAGLKYYMAGGLYVHGEAGAGFGASNLGTSFWYGGGLGYGMTKGLDLELKYVGWHQGTSNSNGTVYTGNSGGSGGSSGGYGGHYSTIDLRLAYKF